MILAGVMLKLGTYGILRFCLPLFPDAAHRMAPLIGVLAIIGIVYGALVATVQHDLKRLVAYTSVSHLGFVVLGIFAFSTISVQGAIYQMLNHGISTGALFLGVGMLYDRRHTHEIKEFGGLATPMPVLMAFFLFICLSSLALPPLNGFIGEFLILIGTFEQPSSVGFLGRQRRGAFRNLFAVGLSARRARRGHRREKPHAAGRQHPRARHPRRHGRDDHFHGHRFPALHAAHGSLDQQCAAPDAAAAERISPRSRRRSLQASASALLPQAPTPDSRPLVTVAERQVRRDALPSRSPIFTASRPRSSSASSASSSCSLDPFVAAAHKRVAGLARR